MSILYKATTEGDCEGRSIKTLGIFQANSKLQVIEYLVANNVELKRKQLIESALNKLTKEEALAVSGYETNYR